MQAADADAKLIRSFAGREGLPELAEVAAEFDRMVDALHRSAAEITDRCLYALVNEGAHILEEGYALRASDIDIIYINGYGFPAHRGGPMWYADTVGLKRVYDRISEFQRQHGEIWQPAPLLKQLAEQGKTFAEFGREHGASA